MALQYMVFYNWRHIADNYKILITREGFNINFLSAV